MSAPVNLSATDLKHVLNGIAVDLIFIHAYAHGIDCQLFRGLRCKYGAFVKGEIILDGEQPAAGGLPRSK